MTPPENKPNPEPNHPSSVQPTPAQPPKPATPAVPATPAAPGAVPAAAPKPAAPAAPAAPAQPHPAAGSTFLTGAKAPPPPAAKPGAPAAAGAKQSRRDFLWTGWAALLTFFAAASGATARFFFPNVLYEPSQKFNAGKAKDYPMGVSTNWLAAQRVWIIRTEKGFYSMWARCTHLGCTPNWFGDQSRFRCPCHGSNFNLDGDVIAGPAPRALWRPSVELAATGDLIIDKAILEDRPGLREKAPFFVEFEPTV